MIRRHATAIAACELCPVPLLDTALQNLLRRNLIRVLARRHGLTMDADAIRAHADEPLVRWQRVGWWPVRRVLKKLVPLWTAGEIVKAYRDAVQLGRTLTQPGADPRSRSALAR